jgi:hypothetical protein
MSNEKIEITNYYLVDIETGNQFENYDTDQPIISPVPPKAGEYLNQSGLYYEVITLLQHFDSNFIDVYVKSLGDSTAFLSHLQNKHQVVQGEKIPAVW